VIALARCESGLIVKFGANFGCVAPHFHRLTVYGTEATFENRPDAGLLWTSRDPAVPPTRIDAAYPAADKGELLPDFVSAVLEDRDPVTSPAEIFDTMAVCLAIETAAREGTRVRVARA
jgi:predicted dehydrogenase